MCFIDSEKEFIFSIKDGKRVRFLAKSLTLFIIINRIIIFIFCISLLYLYISLLYCLFVVKKRKVNTLKEKNGDYVENKVYEHRVLKRMSQKELADAVGVSKQTIYVMEKNNYSPSLVLAFRIANFFDVDVNDIFNYVGGRD